MFTLIAENKYGQQIELTHNEAYTIEDIEGLDPSDAVINTVHNAGDDGSVFNSSYVSNKTITITLAVNGPAEENRTNLYRYFKTKQPVKLYYKNGLRDVSIEGHVKSMPINFFAKKEVAQIVILCNDPFFKNVKNTEVDFSSIEGRFEFPFSVPVNDPIEFGVILLAQEKTVVNNGDVESGCTFILRARGELSNPAIYDVDSGAFFKLDVNMSAGDEIRIETEKSKKKVVELVDGVETNIINKMVNGSTWLQLKSGDNILTTSAESGAENLLAYVILRDKYQGV